MKKILIASLITICFYIGCRLYQQRDEIIKALPTKNQVDIIKDQIKTEILYKNLGWVQSGLIIGCVGGLLAAFLKVPQFGIPVFAACLIGLGLTTARIIYPIWLAAIGLTAGVLIAGYAIWVNRRAFAEIVAGGESLKKTMPQIKSDFSAAYRKQSPRTKKMVDKIQTKLNGKDKNG